MKKGIIALTAALAISIGASAQKDELKTLKKIYDRDELSEREKEILEQLAKGYSTKEIADRSSVSVNTVRTHLQHIYEKLHVRSRTEAVLKYLQ